MYFVTGGAGFIGSAVVRALLGQGAEVVTADALTYAANRELVSDAQRDARHHFVRVDIRDSDSVRAALDRYRPDAILHLAAESHVDRSIDSPTDFVTTNVLGTFVMLSEARRYWSSLPAERASRFRFVHVSTDEVYGSLGATGRFTHASPYDPSSPYAASKAASDHLARAWHCTYGLPVIVTTLSNNYGPYQFPEKLIPLTIANAVLGAPIGVYGDGTNVRDWLFVDDHALALLAILARGRSGETYLVAADAEARNIDVARAICDLVDELCPDPGIGPRRNLIRFVEDRPGHDARYALDASRVRTELAWQPRETFASGLRKTVTWYLDHRDWWQRIRATEYAGQRLGLGAHA